MKEYIYSLIAEGEHQQLDFKFVINDASKIAKTFSAFANTDGGRLLIGVKDNGVIAGIRSEEEYYMIESASQMYTSPIVSFTAVSHNVDGKQVLEVYIPPGKDRPYKAKTDNKWIAYIRKGDNNLLANGIILKYWNKIKNREGQKIRYREDEQQMLTFLQQRPINSISQYARMHKINYQKASNILATMIYLDIVRFNIDTNGVSYYLNPDYSGEHMNIQ